MGVCPIVITGEAGGCLENVDMETDDIRGFFTHFDGEQSL